MKGLSKTELKVAANLEFEKKYYFTRKDVEQFFKDNKQMINTLYTLSKKKRLISLSKNKYYLVPLRARSGKWTEHSLIIADEMMNSGGYYIGGWYAAHYWKLTDQIPMQIDIYTTKRQGKVTIMNKRFVFHRTTKKALDKGVIQNIENHVFTILSKEATKKWMKSKR